MSLRAETLRLAHLILATMARRRSAKVILEDSAGLHAEEQRQYIVNVVNAHPGALRVEIVVDRIFLPADSGRRDTRQLGVQLFYA